MQMQMQMQMVEGNGFNTSSRDQTDLNSLPDEMLIQILTRIPAQHIHDSSITFVCRKWWQLIRTRYFRHSNLDHSTSGLLISHRENSKSSFVWMTQAGQIEISTLHGNIVWSSCNGLILVPTDRYYHDFIIRNIVTRQDFPLPSFRSSDTGPPDTTGRGNPRLCALSFVANRMEYKVVRMYFPRFHSPQIPRLSCAILTIGADKSWRSVDTSQHLCFAAFKLFRLIPLVTEGFVHWVQDSRYRSQIWLEKIDPHQFVLTLNVETEIITQIPPPPCNAGYYYTYFSAGVGIGIGIGSSYLSLLIGQCYFKWEVWEMKPETREWTKLLDIDLEAHRGLLNERFDRENSKPIDGDCKLIPSGWLKYPQVFVFAVGKLEKGSCEFHPRLHAVYSVQTQSISFFMIEAQACAYRAHRNSLIDLPDCLLYV